MAKYKCSVLNGGEFPIFRVECLDSSKKVFEGNSPTKPWYKVQIRARNIKDKSNQIIGVSGPLFYGFTYNIVTYLIERLPNANLCSNYSFKTYFPKIEPNHLTKDENNNIGEEEEEEEPNEEEEKEQKCNDNSSFEKMQINDIIESTEDIDFKMPTEKLIEQGDSFYDKDDIENAFKCYKEALNRGRKDLLLKCAESCDNFQDKLEYLEQALKEKIPNSFNKWRTSIYKQYYLRKNRGNSSDLARRFEAFQNFSDAAILYDKNKDKINSQICYEKAKINIDNITDGYQQYYFGIFLIEKNDIELAKKMLQKAAMNKISQAETKLKMLSS